jgi:hypothetical protein
MGPSARFDHAVAYDSARSRVVLFGGGANTGLSDTWEWDGTAWTQMQDEGPAARSVHAMAFDSARSRVVLFGGDGGSQLFGDTWEWDGTAWTQVQDTGPSGRSGHAMAFDTQAPRVVLFGGSALSDTWTFANGTWSQLNDIGPGPCERTALAFAGATFLFGGANPAAVPPAIFAQTWELDGRNWTERQDIGPSARSGHAMSFDSDRGKIVLFGGNTAAPTQAPVPVGDTWELPASNGGQPAGGAVPVTITAAPNPMQLGQNLTITVTLNAIATAPIAIPITLDGNELGVVNVQPAQAQGGFSIALPAAVALEGAHTLTATSGGVTVSTKFLVA